MNLLGSIADTSKDGLISFAEFQAFEGLLCTPDALYKTAFQLFDTNGNGSVTYGEFCQVMQKTDLHLKIPFPLDGPFVQRFFGKVNCYEWSRTISAVLIALDIPFRCHHSTKGKKTGNQLC